MDLFGHFKTVTRHRTAVMLHCFRAGIPFRGLVHDLSKFSPTEFIPGALYYEQGKRSPNEHEREIKGYSDAWVHHKGRNPHHWEYWYDVNPVTHRYEPVPMPADFTQMQAHHKYIFTINFSADALGKVDRNQEPVIPGGGEDIEIEGRSSQPVTVTVENVYDFEEEGVEVNDLAPLYADRLVQLDAGLAVNFNSYENANASDHPMGMNDPVGTGLWDQNSWPTVFNGLVLTIEQATDLAKYQADKIGQPCFVIYNANFTNSDTSDMTAETVYFVRSNGSLGTQRTYNNVSSVGQYGYYVSK